MASMTRITEQRKMSKWEWTVLVALILAFLCSSLTGFAQDCDQIRGNTLRLHVIANSDSEKDQSLKLKVRDRILEEEGALLGDAGSRDDAILLASRQLNEIEAIARTCLEENGCVLPVEARITQQWFNTRTYGELTLPAGQYEALQVRIGEAKGQNWWCVLFPPFCLPAARSKADAEEAFQEAAKVVESDPQYEVRFALLEWLEKIVRHFQ